MDEKDGIVEGFRVLGAEILRLTDELRFAGYQIDSLKAEREKLEAENESLNRRLESVHNYANSLASE